MARVFPGMLEEDILQLQPAASEIEQNMQYLKEKISAQGRTKKNDEEKMIGRRSYSPLHMFGLELKLVEEAVEKEQRNWHESGTERVSTKVEQDRGKGKSKGGDQEGSMLLQPQASFSSKVHQLCDGVRFLDKHCKDAGYNPYEYFSLFHPPTLTPINYMPPTPLLCHVHCGSAYPPPPPRPLSSSSPHPPV